MRSLAVLAALVALGLADGPTVAAETTDWFHQAGWGVMTHYLGAPPSSKGGAEVTAEMWNKQVDEFDVPALVDQIASTGAKYLLFTLGQNSGHYCSPNATYDRIVGIVPSKCSRRDLVADLAKALAARNIRLMVYVPNSAPGTDVVARKKLAWRWGAPGGWQLPGDPVGGRLVEFQRNWEAIIREWSLRWGKGVAGWWIDGCYFADEMYRFNDEPNFASFAKALKAGNPDSIVAFNPGVRVPVICHTEHEDYTAGEVNLPQLPKAVAACPGRWLELGGRKVQFHILSYLGTTWCRGERPQWTDEKVIECTRQLLGKGGTLTYDVPIQKSGLIPQPFIDQLRAIGRAMKTPSATPPSGAFQAEPRGFVLRNGKQYIRFDKGRWSAGIEGGRSVRWGLFLWHDQWIHETLHGGKITSGPTLDKDGSISMSGVFSARDSSRPMKYAYRITPAAEGVRVQCELEKSGPLTLSRGVVMHLSADQGKFSGTERVWMRPSWSGTINQRGSGNTDRFLVELDQGRSLCLTPSGYRLVERDDYTKAYAYRVYLVPDDFEVGKKMMVQYTIGFADMPSEFPGQITAMHRPLAIGRVTPSAARVPQYGKLELTAEIGAAYQNPFDSDEVRLDAVFTGPSGKQQQVPGFFMTQYDRQIIDGSELMIPKGNGVWKVRFAPKETGTYSWQLMLSDRTGKITGGGGQFQAVAAQSPGFVRVSRVDPHYFAFDNGRGYFPIGHNLPEYHTTGQLGDEAMRKFAAAKESFNRWWMSASGFGIEWMDRLGWYRQDSAARLDLVLDVAAQLGLYYMLCMDTHQDYRERGWDMNPFNAANGGPCKTAGAWFTDETAKKFYRKRLRYTVARWGYSANVLCWEFGNEFEGWADSTKEIQLAWHKEMAACLRALDPFGHLITTSFWSNTGPEEFWKLAGLDIVQTHCYTNNDGNVAEAVRKHSLHQQKQFDKPHIFGEFGIRSHSSTADKDPQGWGIHNALWAGLFSFCAGGPMPWWHENYLDKLNLYFHFTALANFAADLPLGSSRWSPLPTTPPRFVEVNRKPETRDVVILPVNRWGKAEHVEFTIKRDGTTADDRSPQQLLHGGGHRDIKTPLIFVVDYPRPGKFIVRVGKVSRFGSLRIAVDDRPPVVKDLPCDQGLGKQSVWRPAWKLWETTYDQDFAVEIPAGRHRIRIDNSGKDWVEVTRCTFTDCRVVDSPDVLVCGMKTDKIAILWIQNKESCWFNHAGGGPVGQVDDFTLAAEGLRDGPYRVEWWETWKGSPQRTEEIRVKDGRLPLKVPALKTDVAVKVLPAE